MTFGRNAFYLYLESVFGLITGYVFWLIVSFTLGSSITGVSSSIITMATILVTIFTIGISTGSQRFLGKAHAENDSATFHSISKFMMIFSICTMTVSSVIVVIFSNFLTNLFHISQNMTLIIIVASFSYAMVLSLRATIISASNTRVLIITLFVSSAVRYMTIIPIYKFGLGAEGITVSFVSYYVMSIILMLYFSRTSIFNRDRVSQLCRMKVILTSSVTGWIPNAISIIGTQAGQLFILGIKGASEAGVYFIAFSIYSAISALPMAAITMAFPVMSGMKNGREKLIWSATKFSLFFIVPLATALGVYSSFLLSLFGKDFATGNVMFSLLIMSLVPVEINRAVSNLAYAHGRYVQVLILGIFPSITRVIFYFLLLPVFGSNGIALAFLFGSVVGVVSALLISKMSGYFFPSKHILAITGIPSLLGLGIYFLNIEPILGGVAIVLLSYIILARTHVIKYSEIESAIITVFTKPNVLRKKILVIAKVFFI